MTFDELKEMGEYSPRARWSDNPIKPNTKCRHFTFSFQNNYVDLVCSSCHKDFYEIQREHKEFNPNS